MRILLVNDDGIQSSGLRKLALGLAESHQVTVVVPDGQRSAVGHGITLREPLFVRREAFSDDVEARAVSGTPADCVRLALDSIVKDSVDLVISGPNHGVNVGLDLLYSGTVSAALEAAMHGKKAIAVSACPGADVGEVVKIFLRLLEQLEVEKDIRHVLNVNIPALPAERVKGVKWVPQGLFFPWNDTYEGRVSPDGREYYWVKGIEHGPPQGADTDISAVLGGYVTLTPLSFRLTDDGGFREKQFTVK